MMQFIALWRLSGLHHRQAAGLMSKSQAEMKLA